MKKSLNEIQTCNLKKLLNNKLTVEQNQNLYKELGISKKLLTLLFRKPIRFNAFQIKRLSELTGISTDEILSLIN